MIIISFFIRNKQLIIPTTGKTNDGIFKLIPPVKVFELFDSDIIIQSIKLSMDMGNPHVKNELRHEIPGVPEFIKQLGFKSNKEFEKNCDSWDITLISNICKIYKLIKSKNGWIYPQKADIEFNIEDNLSAANITYNYIIKSYEI